jgi:GDP-L-fucose synthase
MADLEQHVYVAGHRGMVGSAIVRELRQRGYRRIVTRRHDELDLENQNQVNRFFCTQRVDMVYLAAAKVGGILANHNYPVDFLYRNLMMQCNVIHAAFAAGVRRLLFLGSSCIYPKLAPQPMREDVLLTGPLEPTNEPYAIAKIAGLKLCEAYNRQHGARYLCAMPTNLYGPNDNYDLDNSHVLPALIRKFHEAREQGSPAVTIWGTGRPRREFLHVDDLARACVMLMESDNAEGIYNIGVGTDVSIAELAGIVAQAVGYHGELVYDTSKPDGTPRKLLDVSRIHALGWRAEMGLRQGIESTYHDYLRHAAGQALPLA